MSKNTVKKVCLVPDVVVELKTPVKGGGQMKKMMAEEDESMINGCKCRMPKSSAGFLKRMGKKVTKAVKLIMSDGGKKSSRKVMSSSANLARSRSYAENCIIDSQRAEAINDCIEFLHYSSSSLPRSNSLKTSC